MYFDLLVDENGVIGLGNVESMKFDCNYKFFDLNGRVFREF